ncbi:hypothetical protein M3Y95_00042100 [Aphelenchoides besseyi]|nr:hypothetical protein M3Y95_00042100 [Aphelenchoides besseyi]
MNRLRSAYNSVAGFISEVVECRSAFSIPYLFVVNGIFWYVVFYTTTQIQMRILAGLAFLIFCNDVLLASPTGDRSIFLQILMSPVRDLWKTAAVMFCGGGIHQLGEEKKEEALWCSAAAVSCLLIAPVYKYNQINQKIMGAFRNIGSFVKTLLTYWIVRPILYMYDMIKYVVLLRWLPGLKSWLNNLSSNLYGFFDRTFLQRIRWFGSKCADIFRYWFYFYWVSDLKQLLYRHVGIPMLDRLKIVRDYFVYVFGGYWFAPLMNHAAKKTYNLCCYLMSYVNKGITAVVNSVVWPLVVMAYEQVKEVAYVVYDTTGRPVVAVVYQKYRMIEDFALVYFIGPTVKRMIECIPEKNPFCDPTDAELEEFIPGPVGNPEDIVDEEVAVADESDGIVEIEPEMFDDLDDDRFLTRRLQRQFSGSDSSDEEFLLFPKKPSRSKEQSQSNN